MKGRSATLEALSCIADMKPGSIALNVKFIHETAQDAYGHLKEFCKIKAENSSLRTTVRQQKNRIDNLEKKLSWIPVAERLPALGQLVLVHAKARDPNAIVQFRCEICDRYLEDYGFVGSKGVEKWSTPYQYFHQNYEITHWRPLPAPPEGEAL